MRRGDKERETEIGGRERERMAKREMRQRRNEKERAIEKETNCV